MAKVSKRKAIKKAKSEFKMTDAMRDLHDEIIIYENAIQSLLPVGFPKLWERKFNTRERVVVAEGIADKKVAFWRAVYKKYPELQGKTCSTDGKAGIITIIEE